MARRSKREAGGDTPLATDPVVAKALKEFHRIAEAEEPQRKAILAAKNFRAGNQWPDEVKLQRAGAPAVTGQAAQPARPCLTIDRVSQPVRQVSNTVRASNFEIDVSPVGDGADKETARIYKGWIRRIQNEARSDAPIEWAADGAAEGGLAWFRLSAYYINEDGFDQDLRMDRIVNNLSVYCDTSAKKPTRSDAKVLFVTEDMARSDFEREHPDADVASLDAFRATGDGEGWVTEDIIRVAEYWRVEYDDLRVVELNNGQTLKGDAIGDATKGDGQTDIKRERTVRQPKVKWSLITATQELKKTDWLGTRIPFIPILGEELNVDGKSVLRGVIEPAMDSQRMVNYTFSAAIEAIALAPKAPFVAAAGQVDAYKQIWQTANTTNYSYLPYDPTSLLGQPVPPPMRQSTEPAIQAMVLMMTRAEDGIKATTGIFDPSLGNTNPREKSGTAIQALQKQSELGQSNYQDNVTRALIYAGELMVEIGPKILDRPGRIIQILQLDDSAEQVMLGQPFQSAQNGTPQPIPHPQTGQPITDPAQAAQFSAGLAKFYDLSNGKYGVTVTIGKDHDTKRQESSDVLGELIPHLPPEMQAVITPEFIASLDFEDSEKIADIARRALPPNLQPPPQGQPPLPPQVQQQLAQIPHMQQALQQAKQIIDSKQVEKAADIQRVKLEGTNALLLAQMNNAAKILVAHITAAKEAGIAGMEAQEETKATGLQMAHDAYQASLDRSHELIQGQQDHQHALEAGQVSAANDSAQSAQDHGQALEQGAQGQQHALEQNVQQAALAPDPASQGASA